MKETDVRLDQSYLPSKETQRVFYGRNNEYLITDEGDNYIILSDEDSDWVMKLQDLDDDEILENNILFSTTSDNWERITDYPTKPKLEPELEPSTV